MLALLRSTLSDKPKAHRKSASVSATEKSSAVENVHDRDGRIVQLVRTALADERLLPILQSWIDFILQSTSHLQPRRDLLELLSGSLAAQIRTQVLILKEGFATDVGRLASSELEPSMLLEGLERIAILLLPRKGSRRSEDSSRNGEGGSSILGYMSGVFTVEGPAADVVSP
jgi:hypothetical protein